MLKILHLGHCYAASDENKEDLVIKTNAMCLQEYMINHQSVQYLLDNLLPMNKIVDGVIFDHFNNHPGSYILNGDVIINGICPNDYKLSKSRKLYKYN